MASNLSPVPLACSALLAVCAAAQPVPTAPPVDAPPVAAEVPSTDAPATSGDATEATPVADSPAAPPSETDPEVRALIRRGVGLHDDGDYAGAIAVYRQALELAPGDPLALYELANSLSASGEHAQCLEIVGQALAAPGRHETMLYALGGNCADLNGEPERAIELYRKGLEIDPEHGGLNYNLAVTLAVQKRYDEARAVAEDAVAGEPGRASAHVLLARLFQAGGYSAPAVLAYLRFLTVEGGTPRAKQAAQQVYSLMEAGFSKQAENEYTITVGTGDKTDEGDWQIAQLMMSVTAALRTTEEWKDRPEVDYRVEQVHSFLAFLSETDDLPESFTTTHYANLLAGMARAGVDTAFAYVVAHNAGIEGAAEWLRGHPESLRSLRAWLESNDPARNPG